jgi:Fe-S cluster assembly scaffold protein SufB
LVHEMSEIKQAASRARDKPATLGPDVDINKFSRQSENWQPCPLTLLPEDVLKRAFEVGIVPGEESRSGTYFQLDHSVISKTVQDIFGDRVEIMSTEDAMAKYNWFKDYWWKVVKVDTDKYTAAAEENWDQGYFIRILENQKVTIPLQACLFISTQNLNQNVHNVIIAEPGSEAQLITGCTVHPSVSRGLHVGISEFFLKEDAKLTFTMIHNWAQGFDTRPRTGALIGDNAVFVSNYLCFKPVKSLQMYPVGYCRGVNSRVSFNSIVYGSGNSYVDTGAKVVLQGEGSRGQVVARAIATDNAQIYSRGFLQGEHEDSKAHLECRGLLLSDKAMIYAIPELLAKAHGSELSHEAAVGKIAEEQIYYLMSRGLSEAEAEALIVRGFMDVSIFGLPRELEDDIQRIIDITAERAL